MIEMQGDGLYERNRIDRSKVEKLGLQSLEKVNGLMESAFYQVYGLSLDADPG
jgi:hypothetical protein